jgi:pimeloyl-ACP methyl ester carboxylesterase
MQLIPVNGIHLETLTIAGDTRLAPIVFLHEGLGSVAMWREFPAHLCHATGRAGLVYSRRGYGKSTPITDVRRLGQRDVDFMHYEAHTALPALLRQLGIHRPVLFGHSDGGSIALLYAAKHEVASTIVLAPHLFVEQLSVDSIAQAKVAYQTTELRSKLAKYHDDVDSAFWGWNDVWLNPEFRAWTIEAEVSKIATPLLAIQGENDEYGTMRQIDRIAELAPQTQRLKLPFCGHSPHKDQPAHVIAAVTDFLAMI